MCRYTRGGMCDVCSIHEEEEVWKTRFQPCGENSLCSKQPITFKVSVPVSHYSIRNHQTVVCHCVLLSLQLHPTTQLLSANTYGE